METLLGKGLLLIDHDSEEFPVFQQICDLSESEYQMIISEYSLLYDYIDSHSSDIVSITCGDFLDYTIDLMQRTEKDKSIPIKDAHGIDVNLHIASKIMNMGNACMTYRDNRRQHARKNGCLKQIDQLLSDFYNDCDGYRWLIEARNAMVHLDFKTPIGCQLVAKPNGTECEITISPSSILQVDKFKNPKPKYQKWKDELEAMNIEISVPQLVEDLRQKFFSMDQKAKDILYPKEARSSAAAVIRDAIRQFGGKRGTYCFRDSGIIHEPEDGAGTSFSFNYREIDPYIIEFSNACTH